MLKVRTYQLNRLVKIMVANVHPIFSHMLVGFFFHVALEGDIILLKKHHHQYSKFDRVEFTRIRNRRVPLVEGVLTVDD